MSTYVFTRTYDINRDPIDHLKRCREDAAIFFLVNIYCKVCF